MKKLSFNIALGGIVSAVCLLLMFMVGIIPVLVYAFPMLCSLLISIVYYECGLSTSLVTYCSVSLLSLILSPDKESAIIFITFFGHYPISKAYIDKIKNKLLQWVLKLITFNASVLAAYYLIINVFGIVDLSELSGNFAEYGTLAMLLLGNFTFVIYDRAMSRLAIKYLTTGRKLFKR